MSSLAYITEGQPPRKKKPKPKPHLQDTPLIGHVPEQAPGRRGLGPVPRVLSNAGIPNMRVFNDRLEQASRVHLNLFGYEPDPGFALDLVRAGVDGEDDFKRLLSVPRNKAHANAALSIFAPDIQGLVDESIAAQEEHARRVGLDPAAFGLYESAHFGGMTVDELADGVASGRVKWDSLDKVQKKSLLYAKDDRVHGGPGDVMGAIGISSNWLEDFKATAKGIGPGITIMAVSAGLDIRDVGSELARRTGIPGMVGLDLKKRDITPGRIATLTPQMAAGFWHTFTHPSQFPFSASLNFLGAASLAASGAARTAAAVSAARGTPQVGRWGAAVKEAQGAVEAAATRVAKAEKDVTRHTEAGKLDAPQGRAARERLTKATDELEEARSTLRDLPEAPRIVRAQTVKDVIGGLVNRPMAGTFQLGIGAYSEAVNLSQNIIWRHVVQIPWMEGKQRYFQRRYGPGAGDAPHGAFSRVVDVILDPRRTIRGTNRHRFQIEAALRQQPAQELARMARWMMASHNAVIELLGGPSGPWLAKRASGAQKIGVEKAIQIMATPVDDPIGRWTAYHVREIEKLGGDPAQALTRAERAAGLRKAEQMRDEAATGEFDDLVDIDEAGAPLSPRQMQEQELGLQPLPPGSVVRLTPAKRAEYVANHTAQLTAIKLAEKVLDEEPAWFFDLYEQVRKVFDAQEQLKLIHHGLDPETARMRMLSIASAVYGELDPRVERAITRASDRLEDIDAEIAKVVKQIEKVVERRDRKLQPILAKLEYIPTTREMTLEEARARLAVLEKAHEDFRERVYVNVRQARYGAEEGKLTGLQQQQRLRNFYGSKQRGAKLSLKPELMREVDSLLDELVDIDSRDETILAYQAMRREMGDLGGAIYSREERAAERFMGEDISTAEVPLPEVTVPVRDEALISDSKARIKAINARLKKISEPDAQLAADAAAYRGALSGALEEVDPVLPGAALLETLVEHGDLDVQKAVEQYRASYGALEEERLPMPDIPDEPPRKNSKVLRQLREVGDPDLEQAVDDFTEIRRADYDDADEYRGDLEDAWAEVQAAAEEVADTGGLETQFARDEAWSELSSTLEEKLRDVTDQEEATAAAIRAGAETEASALQQELLREERDLAELEKGDQPFPSFFAQPRYHTLNQQNRVLNAHLHVLANKRERAANIKTGREAQRTAALEDIPTERAPYAQRFQPFYYKLETVKYGTTARVDGSAGAPGISAFGVSTPSGLAELTHRATFDSLQMGDFRFDLTTLGPQLLGRTVRLIGTIEHWQGLWDMAVPEMVRGRNMVPIRDIRSVPDDLRRIAQRALDGQLDSRAIEGIDDAAIQLLHETFFPGKVGADGRYTFTAEEKEAIAAGHVKFVDERLIMDKPGQRNFLRSIDKGLTKVFAPINEPFRDIVLFLRPAYAMNALGAAAMQVIHENFAAPLYLGRAIASTKRFGGEVSRALDELAGQTKAAAYVTERGKFYRRPSEVLYRMWQPITDLYFRRAAVLYELKQQGIGLDRASLEKALGIKGEIPPELRAKVVQAGRRGRRAMVDFNLTPFENAVLRHIFFIYAWTSRSALWGVHTLIDHPAASAVLAEYGAMSEEELDRELGLAQPTWFQRTGYFLSGYDSEGSPIVVNTNQVGGGFSTLNDIMDPLQGLFSEVPYAAVDELFGPTITTAVRTFSGRTDFGRELTGGNLVQSIIELGKDTPIGAAVMRNKEAEKEAGLREQVEQTEPDITDRKALVTREHAAQELPVFQTSEGFSSTWGSLIWGGTMQGRIVDEVAATARYWRDQPQAARRAHELGLINEMLAMQAKALGRPIPDAIRSAVRLSQMLTNWREDWNEETQHDGTPPAKAEALAIIKILENTDMMPKQEADLRRKTVARIHDHYQMQAYRKALQNYEMHGEALRHWDEDVRALAHITEDDSFDLAVAQLQAGGMGVYAGSAKMTAPTKLKYARQFVKYLNAQDDMAGAMEDLPSDEFGPAAAGRRRWEQDQDRHVVIDGVTFPSPARMAWALTSPSEREEMTRQAVVDRTGHPSAWQYATALEKELLGRKQPQAVQQGWEAFEITLLDLERSLPPGQRRISSERKRVIAGALDRRYPGFLADYDFSKLPLVERYAATRLYTLNPQKAGMTEIVTVARQFVTALNVEGSRKTFIRDFWKDHVRTRIMPWLKQPENAALKAEVDVYGPNFLYDLLES